MMQMANPETKKDSDNEEEEEEVEDDDDVEQAVGAAEATVECKSDDEEMWYDTNAFGLELKTMSPETVGLMASNYHTLNEMTSASSSIAPLKRPGSIISDEGFDFVTLKDSKYPSSILKNSK